jgi:penicillin amidase
MKRWLKRIALGFVALIILAALGLGGYVWSFARSVPSYSGGAQVTGLKAPVNILRDRYAIPHIRAQSFEDAAFGLGYAHAQDRLWQMEMARRFVQGRLSEMFGASALAADASMRAMGLYEAAQDAVPHLSEDARRVLEAYAAGVNAYLHEGRPLPIEFALAGVKPEPWMPADSVAVLKGMAFQLSGNMYGEVARAQLVPVLGRKGVQDFFPPFSAAPLPSYLDDVYLGTRTGQAYGVPDTTASDNWVVDGAHSVTGKPLLANDPHLGFGIPSVWYLAHLSFGDEDIVGGTLAGLPAIVAGRNRHVAWGETNTGPDTQDLFLEHINPDNPRQYQTPGGFADFDIRAETINVRFGQPRGILVRSTRHGPVMSDASTSSFAAAVPRGYALALSWTALAPDDTTLDAILAINRARNADDAKKTAKLFVAPMQNIVFADDEGHIGLMLPGRVPLRSEKNDSLGLVPAPGWDGRYDWQGTIPPEGTFALQDPPSGRIATANNKTVPDSYEYTLTREWEANYRYDRIMSLLAASEKQSVASFAKMQTDTIDNYALALKSRLVAAGGFPDADDKAAQLIRAWNGSMERNRPEPLIFTAWTRALARRIYADELGPNFAAYWGYRTEFTLRVLDNDEGEGRWCDDRSTPDVEDCASRIRLALHDAVAELSEALGSDPGRWRWGDVHKAIHRAQPFGLFPMIGGFFNREAEMDGGAFTLLRADMSFRSATPYAAIHGAGYRGIYDLADPDNSLFVISTGQSGNVFSSHYDDLLGEWAKGQYIKIPTQPDAVTASAVDRLTLQPAP